MVFGLIQLFFPFGDAARFVFSLLGAIIFCGYLVYDTQSIMQRFSIDEWVWAAVNIYLDIINLFIRIVQILSYLQGNSRD
mmetsp:Transcript_355/g.1167  ORF Transcript_355/g.1167 Transcript_355/m.1167 type:complete len:80 (-) Transcript_355:40-279(-)